MKKALIIGAIILVLAAIAYFVFFKKKTSTLTPATLSPVPPPTNTGIAGGSNVVTAQVNSGPTLDNLKAQLQAAHDKLDTITANRPGAADPNYNNYMANIYTPAQNLVNSLTQQVTTLASQSHT